VQPVEVHRQVVAVRRRRPAHAVPAATAVPAAAAPPRARARVLPTRRRRAAVRVRCRRRQRRGRGVVAERRGAWWHALPSRGEVLLAGRAWRRRRRRASVGVCQRRRPRCGLHSGLLDRQMRPLRGAGAGRHDTSRGAHGGRASRHVTGAGRHDTSRASRHKNPAACAEAVRCALAARPLVTKLAFIHAAALGLASTQRSIQAFTAFSTFTRQRHTTHLGRLLRRRAARRAIWRGIGGGGGRRRRLGEAARAPPRRAAAGPGHLGSGGSAHAWFSMQLPQPRLKP
jgi:hypothetical protein